MTQQVINLPSEDINCYEKCQEQKILSRPTESTLYLVVVIIIKMVYTYSHSAVVG